jgi:transposase InsO family protein
MDLQGPFETQSIQGYRYLLAIIDCHSRHGWKIFLKAKDETGQEIQTFITQMETQTDMRVKGIRCDGETEFINKAIKDFCKQKGITIEQSAPYTHQQNGVAERFN